MNKFEEAKNENAVTTEEGDFLYGLIRAIKPLRCVETGTHRGYSALHIAQALFDNKRGHLVTCDIKEMGAQDYFNKFELDEYITFKNIKGKDLETEVIDFLFIDGFHEKEIVKEEFKNFYPKLRKDAIVVFHDCGGDNELVGVNGAIKEMKLKTVLIPTKNVMRIYVKD